MTNSFRWVKGGASQQTLKDMHAALGEFLTECGRVENAMFGLAISVWPSLLPKLTQKRYLMNIRQRRSDRKSYG